MGSAFFSEIRHVVDATCPFVKKIHRIVEQKGNEGYEIVITGSAVHPEVEGICGWCTGEVTVVETEEEALSFVQKTDKKLCIVSQTTFDLKKFYKFVEIIRGLSYQIRSDRRNCSFTRRRSAN